MILPTIFFLFIVNFTIDTHIIKMMSLSVKINALYNSNHRLFISLFGAILSVIFISFLYEVANRPLELIEKIYFFLFTSLGLMVLQVIIADREISNSDLSNTVNAGIGVILLVIIAYFIVKWIQKDPIDAIILITVFLINVIFLLVIPAIVNVSDLPEELNNLVSIATIGAVVLYILFTFIPWLSIYFGFAYSIFLLAKMDENNKTLYHLNKVG